MPPLSSPDKTQVFSLDIDQVAVAIADALNVSGWSVSAGGKESRYITAELDEIKIYSQEYRSSYKYHAIFRWTELAKDRVNVLIRVAELTGSQESHDELRKKQDALFASLNQEILNRGKRPLLTADPRHYPVAVLADEKELEAAGMFDKHDDSRRFILYQNSNRKISLSFDNSIRHVFLCGPTGSGKSRGVFVPNLLYRLNTSAIVTEVIVGKNDDSLYSMTSGWRRKEGQQKIYYFNPGDPCSFRINPLDQIETDSDARDVADLIIRTTTLSTHRGDQFWESSERLLLTALILHCAGERKTGKSENCTLSHIRKLLNKGDSVLKEILSGSRVVEAAERFAGFIDRGSDNTRNIVISSLAQRLDVFSDELVSKLTDRTNIPMHALGDKLFTLYLAVPAGKSHLQPLTILIWNYVLKILEERDFKQPLTLFLDEFANFGYIKGMREKLTLLRHKQIGAVLGVQYLHQLTEVYGGEAQAFFTQPATRIFFKPQGLNEAEEMSNCLGQTTVAEELIQGGRTMFAYHKKPLLSAPDLLKMKKWEMLIFLPDVNPAMLTSLTYEDTKELVGRYPVPAIPPVEFDSSIKIRRAPMVKAANAQAIVQSNLSNDAAKSMRQEPGLDQSEERTEHDYFPDVGGKTLEGLIKTAVGWLDQGQENNADCVWNEIKNSKLKQSKKKPKKGEEKKAMDMDKNLDKER